MAAVMEPNNLCRGNVCVSRDHAAQLQLTSAADLVMFWLRWLFSWGELFWSGH